MRIAILGAGVVGVSAAWQLLKDGHEVVVIDRAAEPAAFTSHANAGCNGAGFAFAWGSKAAPRTMLRSVLRRDQKVRLGLGRFADPHFWGWTRRFLRECTGERFTANTLAMARLCAYSQSILRGVVDETGVAYDQRPGGLMYYFRSEDGFARAAAGAALLEQGGVAIERLDGAAVRRHVGALTGNDVQLAGGLYAPNDDSGDARMFTQALAEKCRAAGAELRMGETVRALSIAGGRVTGVETDAGRIEADAVVVSLGVYSRALLRPHLRRHGFDLPIYPVKGYSATFPVGAGHKPPAIGGVDVDAGLAFATMGNRLRMTRTVQFAGYDTGHKPADFRVMLALARTAFPAAADYDRPTHWAGLRPMTPTGLPVIDATPVDGLWINSGQGNFGWTLASGSARLLADRIAGRPTAVPAETVALGS